MKIVNISCWKNKDALDVQEYIASYSIHDEGKELFNINLMKQKGFYQLCEFTESDERCNFVIEQTNRAGTPKVAAFDKETGLMLGTFKTNSLVDQDEDFVFQLLEFSKTKHQRLMEQYNACADDFVALDRDKKPAVLFIHLPKINQPKPGLLSKIKSMANNISQVKHDVYQVVILNNELCDERMFFAIGVILHDRGGLQIL